jgi:hypothetical protein
MSRKPKKTISRRKFLKGSVTLSVAALARRPLGERASLAQFDDVSTAPAPDGPAADDLDYHVYLPFVAKSYQGVEAAHGPSKIGLHTIRSNNAVPFVQAVADAGAHVALVKGLDNFGHLGQVKAISPETVTVGRWNRYPSVDPTGDPVEKATWMMDRHMAEWDHNRSAVDYWEILNENAPPSIAGHVWLGEFFIAAMDIAEVNGYELALFSYSTGVPQWHHWEAIVETGVFARAKTGGHVLSLHEYDWPVMDRLWGQATEDLPPYEDRGVLACRYRYLYRDFLIPRDEVIPLVITEAGLDPVVGGPPMAQPWQERYVEEMIWYDTKLREDDYVVGAALFTIGPTSAWQDYDYEDLLWPGNQYGEANFLDYIVSLKDA